MKPPYKFTARIIELIASISEKIGEVNAAYLYKPSAELRKKNRIKTIQSSLEIEGNSLSLEQVTAILDNKRIIGPKKDIIEVRNAIKAYEDFDRYNPASRDLKLAVDNGILEKTGDKRTTLYKFKK